MHARDNFDIAPPWVRLINQCSVQDMYVDFHLGAQTMDGIAGARAWVTSEFLHSGVREDGPRVFNTLLSMARGEDPVR